MFSVDHLRVIDEGHGYCIQNMDALSRHGMVTLVCIQSATGHRVDTEWTQGNERLLDPLIEYLMMVTDWSSVMTCMEVCPTQLDIVRTTCQIAIMMMDGPHLNANLWASVQSHEV